MRMSSGSRSGIRLLIVLSTTPAGTINQTTLGFCSFFTRSCSEDDPTAFSPASSLTALGDMSKTTHSWPPLIRRRTMLAPILPRPTIPNCMNVSLPWLCYFLCAFFLLSVTTDQIVGRTVVGQHRFGCAFDFRNDALGQRLA